MLRKASLSFLKDVVMQRRFARALFQSANIKGKVGGMTPLADTKQLGKVLCPSGWRNHHVLCGIYGCNLWNGLVLRNPKAGLNCFIIMSFYIQLTNFC